MDRSSPLDVVREAFETEVLRSLVLFNVSVRGYLPNLDVPELGSAEGEVRWILEHRLEGQVTFTALAQRFPDLRLAGDDLEYREHFILRGLTALPVTT